MAPIFVRYYIWLGRAGTYICEVLISGWGEMVIIFVRYYIYLGVDGNYIPEVDNHDRIMQ